ncbi:MAG: BrnT family toxin, partial [Gemmatimonadetes bacterium]|nr:BrnT family toxin [Gemmatimonadota bacterium]
MDFEWEEAKARANLDKHGVDFDDAVRVFDCPMLLRRSDRGSEPR